MQHEAGAAASGGGVAPRFAVIFEEASRAAPI